MLWGGGSGGGGGGVFHVLIYTFKYTVAEEILPLTLTQIQLVNFYLFGDFLYVGGAVLESSPLHWTHARVWFFFLLNLQFH